MIIVNRGFDGQRVTGQQRYGHEIACRLGRRPDVIAAAPRGVWASSTLRVWAWVQVALPLVARGQVLLSMTSRGPVWSRRHVLVVHDLFVLEHPEWYSRRYIWTHAPLLRAQIWCAAAVVAVSEPTAARLRGLRHDEVPIAPNAPSEQFRASDGDADEALVRTRGLEPGAYLLAVGSRDPRKNLSRLAAAYAALEPAQRAAHPLVVVGAPNAIFADEVVSWPVGTVDAGYVDDDSLRAFYRHARCVVLISLDEGFGLPLVEAALAGTRGLLVSDIPVFRWLCGDQARYVDPLSVLAVADGLRREIDSPQDREIILDQFTWDDSAAVIAEVCARVAGR